MFDYATARPTRRMDRSRVATASISITIHLLVTVAVAVPALFATGALPEPPTMVAFVIDAIDIPPPPPPPPPAIEPPRTPPAKRPVAVAKPRVHRQVPPAPAPVEAPTGITEETGFEADTTSMMAAGFETAIPGGIVGGVIGAIDHVAPVPPPPPPVVKAPIRVGGQVTPPRLVRRVPPEYPLLAQRAQIEGTVILEATVDDEGHVEAVRVLRSHSVLDEAAVDAVSQWVYEPLILNGEPQPFVLTVTVSLNLERPQ